MPPIGSLVVAPDWLAIADHFAPALLGVPPTHSNSTLPTFTNLQEADPATILSEVGHLIRWVSPGQLSAWKRELAAHQSSNQRLARLHIWLGEYALAQDEQPETAVWHFRQAEHAVGKTDPAYGMADYDTALAVYYEGAYQASADDFHALLKSRLFGYPRQTAALWYKEASECTQYHASHERIGIPEPTRLDPLCAAAAIAARLQSMSLPYDKANVLRAVHVGGEGSTLQDVIDAGPKLSLSIRAVRADDAGLLRLPKPLVAWVERDHFVAVIDANKHGVSYLCSDCGPWPGGRVDLTWKQWHTMSPGIYAVITKPGSGWDQAISEAMLAPQGLKQHSRGVQVASANLAGLGLAKLAPQAHVLAALLAGHVIDWSINAKNQGCGNRPGSLHSSFQNCPCDKSPNGDPVELATGEEQYTPDPDLTVYNPYGPSVSWSRIYNSLRAMAPDYESDDWGPGWSQNYNVALYDPTMVYAFGTNLGNQTTSGGPTTGSGSTTGGNNSTSNTGSNVVTNGSSTSTTGTTSPPPPDFWLTLNPESDTIQACSAPPSVGSTVTVSGGNGFSGTVSLSVSVSGNPSSGPQVTASLSPTSVSLPPNETSSLAITIPSNPMPGTYTITVTGSCPGFTNQTATYTLTINSCTTESTTTSTTGENPISPNISAQPSPEGGLITENGGTPPPTYSPPTAGNKDLILPNGADITIAFPATGANDLSATCTAELNNSTDGVPLTVVWNRGANTDQFGVYTITLPDRTVWTMSHIPVTDTRINPQTETGVPYVLTQITDRTGHAITLNYGYLTYAETITAPDPNTSPPTKQETIGYQSYGGVVEVAFQQSQTYYIPGFFPLLTTITGGGGGLLTIRRVADYEAAFNSNYQPQLGDVSAGNIVTVSDCYGRTILYHTGTYASQNVIAAAPQALQCLDYVSLVQTTAPPLDAERPENWNETGTGGPTHWYNGPSDTPAARYSTQYTNVTNGDPGTGNGGETIPCLSLISFPSPTGTGAAHMAINYDSLSYVSSVVDANGNTRAYTNGSVPTSISGLPTYAGAETVSIYAPGANTPTYAHTVAIDNNMNLLADTDGAGNLVVTYTYNDPNDLYGPDTVTDGNGNKWKFVYDQWGNVHQATDPRNTVTNYTWGYPTGSVPTVVNSTTDSTTSFLMGELMSVKEGTKSATTFAYQEPSGLVQTVTYPAPGTVGGSSPVSTTYAYNTYGDPVTITQPNNNATTAGIITTLTYYQNSGAAYLKGEVATITDNAGDVSSFSYTPRGAVAQAVDANGNATSYSYNVLDQPIQVQLPATGMTGTGQGSTSYTYAYLGGPVIEAQQFNESNAQVASTSYTLDQEGNTLSVTGTQPTVSYTYDAAGRLATIKDGNNHVTTYSYNNAGYLSQVVYPGATSNTVGSPDTITYPSYDNDGNPLTRVDGRNITTTYTYNDPESLLTGISYSDHTTSVGVSYDSYGRANQVTDGAGTTTYSFDDNDGVTNKSVSFSGGPNASLSYSYYPDGSLSQTSTPAGVFNYTYDKAQRLTDLTNPQGQGTHYKYLPNDWLQRQADYYGPESSGTGVLMDYTYDPLGEPTAIANDQFLNQNGTYQPTFNNITYNGLGQITAYTSTNTGTVNYTYDADNRLHTESNNGIINNTYVSDAANNLTTVRGGAVTYNADNQRATAIYDGNGNLTSTTLTYDAENRMTAFNGTVSETNGYFADGLRAWNNTSAGKTFFLYDDGVPVCELNSSGSVTATNTFGPNGLVSRTAGGTTNWYTFDPQGNTSVIYQGFNNSSSQNITDAYGAMVSGTFTTPYDGFGGQYGNYHDPTTGWFLMGHRFYAAGQARFVNRDPIGYGGGINQYAYTGNDPMNGIDPSGFQGNNPPPDIGKYDPTHNSDNPDSGQDSIISQNLGSQGLPGGPGGSTASGGGGEGGPSPVDEFLGKLFGGDDDTPPEAPPAPPSAAPGACWGNDPIFGKMLMHFTDAKGLTGILKEGVILPSLEGGKDARYGSGQYFTDLVPGSMRPGQIARRLYGQPNVGNRLNNVIAIDPTGLPIENPAPNIYLNPSSAPLDINGRIIYAGPTSGWNNVFK